MIEETKAYQLSPNFKAFAARRNFARGDMESAERWIEAQSFGDPVLRDIYAAFTTCRAFIAVRNTTQPLFY